MPFPCTFDQKHEQDVLKEVFQMGAAHAATAIGSLLGKGVDITIPRIWFLELSQLKEFLSRLPKRCVCITTGFSGDGSGSLLLLFPASQIRNLKRILLSGFSPESNSYEPRDKSPDDDLILELGNIVMSHYLNAIADFWGVRLCSIPQPWPLICPTLRWTNR